MLRGLPGRADGQDCLEALVSSFSLTGELRGKQHREIPSEQEIRILGTERNSTCVLLSYLVRLGRERSWV